MSKAPRCDFCGDELRFETAWTFPCRDHVQVKMRTLPIDIASEGDWGACDPCKRLIVAGARDALARRGVRGMPRAIRQRVGKKRAVAATRQVQDLFWSQRTGPPRRETREEWDAWLNDPDSEPRFEPPRWEAA